MGVHHHHPLYFLAVATRACHRLCFCDLRGFCDSPPSKQTSPFDDTGKWGKNISSSLESSSAAWRLGTDTEASTDVNRSAVLLRNIDPLSASRRGGNREGTDEEGGGSESVSGGGSVGETRRSPSSGERMLQSTSEWDQLPIMILAKVIPELGGQDQGAFRQVCKFWHQAHSENMKVLRPGQFEPATVCALFPFLLSLDLSRCQARWRSSTTLTSLTLFTGLKSLNLSGWEEVSQGTVVAMRAMPALATVRLVRCPRLGEAALGELATLPRLALLSVAECQSVNDQGLSRLAAAPCLTSLDLGRCVNITDAGVAALTAMRSLLLLNLGGCLRITDTGVACLSRIRLFEHPVPRNKYARYLIARAQEASN